MRDDLNERTTGLNRQRNAGMGTGTITAIIAALIVVGALYMWGPWNSTDHNALNSGPAVTTGQTSTAPAANTPGAPTAITPAAPATTPANPAPTTR